MFKQSGLLDRKWVAASFNKVYGKIWDGFCLNIRKTLFRGFILKPIERAYVPLKSGTRDFWNRPPFKRSVGFYLTITGGFECFSALWHKFSEMLKFFSENWSTAF